MPRVPRISGKRGTAIVICVAGVLGAMIVRVAGVVALVAPAVLGVLMLLLLVRGVIRWPDEEARRRILWWTMVAFGAHLLFGLFGTLSGKQIRFYLSADSFNYDATARAIVHHWTTGMPYPFVPSGKEGFYYLLAALYWIFGSHLTAGLAVNATLAAALVPMSSDVTERLFGSAAARYAAPLVVALPGMFLWTSQLMREAGMLFLLVVALDAAVRIVERLSVSAFAVLIGSLLLAFTFRAWVALVVAAALLLGLVLGHRRLLQGMGAGIGVAVVVSTLMLVSGLGYRGYQAATKADLKQANTVRRELALVGQTGYAAQADISTTQSALAYLPRGMLNFVLGPFPWEIHGARQLPFVPDMVAWWFLLPSLWRGIWSARQMVGRKALLIFLPSVACVLLMSLTLGNYGTVVRERLQVQALVVPLIALGLAERRARLEQPEAEVVGGATEGLALRT